MKPVQNQSVGHLKAQKYCFITRSWPGPPVTAVVEIECQGGECSENMAFREGTPRLNPKVLAPLPPTSAPLTTARGCLVLGNHSSGSKAPSTLQLQSQSFKLLLETLVAWGKAFSFKLSAQSCLRWLSEPVCAACSLKENRDGSIKLQEGQLSGQ